MLLYTFLILNLAQFILLAYIYSTTHISKILYEQRIETIRKYQQETNEQHINQLRAVNEISNNTALQIKAYAIELAALKNRDVNFTVNRGK